MKTANLPQDISVILEGFPNWPPVIAAIGAVVVENC